MTRMANVHMFARRARSFTCLAGGLFAGVAAAAMPGCEDGVLGDLAEQCGLVCPVDGLIKGNTSISGVASIDAFFGAVVTFGRVAAEVGEGIDGELRAIALSLGLEPGASGAAIKAAIQTKLSAALTGELKVRFTPPRCAVSIDATIEATAKCDVDFDPGRAEVRCEGSCEVDASVMTSCEAGATVKCVGAAPDLDCSGSCIGDCRLDVAAACDGTCRGTCDGTCTVTDAQGNCAGHCDGTCVGTCELGGGGSCVGKCQGACEYTPGNGSCEADAQIRCEAAADAGVQCRGRCDGTIEPPKARAECEASAKAVANANVQCIPPDLEIAWQWSAEFEQDLDAQAEFKAWLAGFKVRQAALLAAIRRSELVLEVGADLTVAASGAVKGAIDVVTKGEIDLRTGIGLGCALTELDSVGVVVGDGVARIQHSLSEGVEVTAAVPGD